MKMFGHAAALLLSMSSAGCVRVHPYEREYLSERVMQPGRERPEDQFRQHWQGSREGSAGGSGAVGGGCGCN